VAGKQGVGEPPLWERLVALVGSLLVLASVVYLLYQGIWGDHSPPDIVIEQIDVMDSGADHLVRFRARNQGGKTAAEVIVRGVLERDGEQIETAEASIDYIPPGSEQQGGLYFSHDPRQAQLTIGASGYRLP